MDWHGVPGIGPRRHRGSIRPDPPVLDQEHLVAVDGDGFAFLDDQRPRPRGSRLTVAQQVEVAQEGPGVAQWQLQGFLAAGRERRPARQRFGGRDAIDPAPVEDGRHREFVAEGDIEGLTTLEAKFGPCSDQIGVAGAFGRRATLSALACNASADRAWARPATGHIGARAAAPRPAISSRRSSGNSGLPSDRSGPFFVVSVLAVTPCPGAVKKGHFFAAEV